VGGTKVFNASRIDVLYSLLHSSSVDCYYALSVKKNPEDDGLNVETCQGRVKSMIIKLDMVHLVLSYFSV
jgi:hypothetical protein